MNFALQADLAAHSGGASAEFAGRENVAGFVDQGAGEVLAFSDDDAFIEALLQVGLRCLIAFVVKQGDGVDGEILAVAAVDVDVELGRA